MTIKPLLTTEYSKLLRLCHNMDIIINRKHIAKNTSRLNFSYGMDLIYTTNWDNRFSLCMPTFKLVRKAIRNDIVECDEDIAI